MDVYIIAAARELRLKECGTRQDNTSLRWEVRNTLTGECILTSSKYPFFNAARELIKRGVDPEAMLYLVPWADQDLSRWRLRGTLRRLAKWTVQEPDDPKELRYPKIKPYRPHPMSIHGSGGSAAVE